MHIIFFCMPCMHVHPITHLHDQGQRTACRSPFMLSTMWVPSLNLGHQPWWQVLLLADASLWLNFLSINGLINVKQHIAYHIYYTDYRKQDL